MVLESAHGIRTLSWVGYGLFTTLSISAASSSLPCAICGGRVEAFSARSRTLPEIAMNSSLQPLYARSSKVAFPQRAVVAKGNHRKKLHLATPNASVSIFTTKFHFGMPFEVEYHVDRQADMVLFSLPNLSSRCRSKLRYRRRHRRWPRSTSITTNGVKSRGFRTRFVHGLHNEFA